MINDQIKKELEKLGVYQEGIYEYHFGMESAPKSLTLGSEYKLSLKDYILHPYPGFTLHENWNGGNPPPTTNIIYCIVRKLSGKMVFIEGKCDDGVAWSGWLPIKSVDILEVIK